MKNYAHCLTLIVLANLSCFGQGTIKFNNRLTGQVDAPISRAPGVGAGAGWIAQLFLVSGNGSTATYTPLFPSTTFRTTSPAAAFYVNEPTTGVIVPGVLAGQTANIVLRAWVGREGGFEIATARGESNIIPVSLGGVPAQGAPIPDAVLTGLQGWTIPEPSTIALGVLGAAALLYRRRS